MGAAAIVMAGIFLLAGGKPVVAKAEKIKKVKIASAEKTVLINKKEKIQLKAKVKPASMKKKAEMDAKKALIRAEDMKKGDRKSVV